MKEFLEKIERFIQDFFEEATKSAEVAARAFADFEKKRKELEEAKEANPEEVIDEEAFYEGIQRPNISNETDTNFEDPDQISQHIINIKEGIDNKHKTIVGIGNQGRRNKGEVLKRQERVH